MIRQTRGESERSRCRAALGSLLAIVLLLCLVLAILGMGSLVQSTGTGRTYSRVVDTRLVLEAADAALSEAVVHLRRSMDENKARPPACPDNWRQLLFDVFRGPEHRPSDRTIVPVRTRAIFEAEVGPLLIDNVLVSVVGAYVEPPGLFLRYPPQGVLEMSVTVRGAQKVLQVGKTVRQRRIFYLLVRREVAARRTLRSDSTRFTLLSDPLGTVVE